MSAIVDVIAREILDSRGNPTVEADVVLESGVSGRAAVPSGASTGSKEAIELRDGDPKRYLRQGRDQGGRERQHRNLRSDPRPRRHRAKPDRPHADRARTAPRTRAASARTRCSRCPCAVAKAGAEESSLPLYRYLGGAGEMQLPVPQMNVINGGAHANNKIDLQEFMIVPLRRAHVSRGAPLRRGGLSSTQEDDRRAAACRRPSETKAGSRPTCRRTRRRCTLLVEAIDQAGYTPGTDIALALDCAASEFFKDGRYHLEAENRALMPEQFADVLAAWADKYPIISIEDGMSEHDWDGWKYLTERVGKNVQLVGDDIFVTNTKLLRAGASRAGSPIRS